MLECVGIERLDPFDLDVVQCSELLRACPLRQPAVDPFEEFVQQFDLSCWHVDDHCQALKNVAIRLGELFGPLDNLQCRDDLP